MERVEGGGYGESNRDGPGSTKLCCYGKVALLTAITHVINWDTAPLSDAPFIREELLVETVCADGSPNSSYNEYICYTNVSLCELSEHMGFDV